MKLEVDELCVSFGDRIVAHVPELAIESGESIGIVWVPPEIPIRRSRIGSSQVRASRTRLETIHPRISRGPRDAISLRTGVAAVEVAGGRRDADLRLRREPVFVDQPAEKIAAADALEVDRLGGPVVVELRWQGERRPLLERSVRPVLVVMRDVRSEDVVEVAPAEDQQSIQALATQCPDQRSA